MLAVASDFIFFGPYFSYISLNFYLVCHHGSIHGELYIRSFMEYETNCIYTNDSMVGSFNETETDCGIARNLGILLMNSNYYFQQHSSDVCFDIYL